MSRIDIIKERDEFEDRVNQLYDEIIAAKEQRASEYLKIGCSLPERIGFEELDLSQIKTELLEVHKTLQWKGHNYSISSAIAKKARYVAIAGVCEMIKDEYLGKFWDLHEKVIGWGRDNTVCEWIWNTGFREAGIEMLGYERREFVQTLVLESGVPKDRAADIIKFFEIYWRYLRGEDAFEVIQNLDTDFASIPRAERIILRSLASTATEYSRAFALAVSRLSSVFEFISKSDEIFGGSIDDWSEKIFRATGVNPLTVLRDGEQLRSLYGRILGFVTPGKLSMIISAKPPGTEVILPEGRKVRSDHYVDIQLGEHRIDGALFTCLPATGLELPFLVTLPLSSVIEHNDAYILRSRAEITALVDGFVRSDLVRKLYSAKADCGNLFYCTKKTASEIALSTSDGRVNQVLSGNDGFVCYPFLYYQNNYQKGTHSLSVKMNSLRLASADFKEQEFCFICDQEKEPLCQGETDQTGRGLCSERSVFLEFPTPGEILFTAVDASDNEVLLLQGGEARVTLTLSEFMLFSPFSHRQIKPRQNGLPFLFGSRRFTIYTTREVESDSVGYENFDIESTAEVGGYRISVIVWKDQSQPCRIEAKTATGQIVVWNFKKCLDFKLYINPKDNGVHKYIEFKENQRNRPADFELVLNPMPDKETCQELFFNIIVNDSTPLKVSLEEYYAKHLESKTLRINGTDLERMLEPLWSNLSPVTASIEIALCAADETLASRKFFVFPQLNVRLPDGVRDGEIFMVNVDLGKESICRDLMLKNPRGRSKVKGRFEFNNEQWMLHQSVYKGTLEIESLETSISVEAIPPYRAILYGNRENGKVEPAREILRRELGPYDLIVATDNHFPPEITVNGNQPSICFSNVSDNLWTLPMAELKEVVRRENDVKIRSLGLEGTVIIKYRVAIINLEPQKYLLGREVTGNCSFRGPIDSQIELRLVPIYIDGTTGDVVSQYLQSEGQIVHDFPFSIKVTEDFITGGMDHYELSARLIDNPKADNFGYEYGEHWEILPESSATQKDFSYIKNRILELIEKGKPFAAEKYLAHAQEFAPEPEKVWLKEVKLTIRNMLLRTSLNSSASQMLKVLEKEYLFEL